MDRVLMALEEVHTAEVEEAQEVLMGLLEV